MKHCFSRNLIPLAVFVAACTSASATPSTSPGGDTTDLDGSATRDAEVRDGDGVSDATTADGADANRPTDSGSDAVQRAIIGPHVGVNLSSISYYSVTSPFIDAAKNFAPWVDLAAATSNQPVAPAQLTASKYPLIPARTLYSFDTLPDGDYEVWFDGTATLTASGRATMKSPCTVSGTSHRCVMTITHAPAAGGAAVFEVSGLDGSAQFGNLRVFVPGYGPASKATFLPAFLDLLKPFAVLRSMDWTKTNQSPIKTWADRAAPGDFASAVDIPKANSAAPPSYDRTRAVPYEELITLANVTGKSLWVNIPDQVDDDYVVRMADQFRDGLDLPAISLLRRANGETGEFRLYVEFSNELWNTGFVQGKRLLESSSSNVLIVGTSSLERTAQAVAFRAKEVMDLFRAEFAHAGKESTLLKVLGGQGGNPTFLRAATDFLKTNYVTVTPSFDALTIATYTFLGDQYDVAGLTLDDLFSRMNEYLSNRLVPGIQGHRVLADANGLALVGYEAGQSLEAFDRTQRADVNVQVKWLAQYDRRMAEHTTAMYNAWLTYAGGGVLSYYSLASQYGKYFWGLLEGTGEDSTACSAPSVPTSLRQSPP